MQPDQLSKTATFIAIKFYGLSREKRFRTLFESNVPGFYSHLVQQLPLPLSYYHPALTASSLRRFFMFWEELMLPGDLMHILMRKWYLNRWVNQLQEYGYRQLLVLGSGFDHLAALAARRGMQCLELDAPQMAAHKRDFVYTYDYDHPQLDIRDCFFTRDSLQQVLSSSSLSPSRKTVIVAEGFFDYFTRDDAEVFLRDLNVYFTGNCMLLSTLFCLDELSAPRAFIYRNSIRLAGEELKLEMDHTSCTSMFEQHGFLPRTVVKPEHMKRNVLIPNNINYPILDGFYLIQAQRS